MRLLVLFAALLALPTSASGQEPGVFWKCVVPERPFRIATTEEVRAHEDWDPPCEAWHEIRFDGLLGLQHAIAHGESFPLANHFLALAGPSYPTTAWGAPASTRSLYEAPEAFGFAITNPADAPTGSFVVYDGLGGFLVEVRSSPAEPWTRQVLYPSAQLDYSLAVRPLDIPGKQAPKVLVQQHDQ